MTKAITDKKMYKILIFVLEFYSFYFFSIRLTDIMIEIYDHKTMYEYLYIEVNSENCALLINKINKYFKIIQIEFSYLEITRVLEYSTLNFYIKV